MLRRRLKIGMGGLITTSLRLALAMVTLGSPQKDALRCSL